MQNKKLFFAILATVVIIAAAAVWGYLGKGQVKAYEFAGRIEKIEGNVIFTKGVYQNEENPKGIELAEAEKQIVVSQDTELVKITQIMPTVAELEASGGFYEPEKLKSEQSAGSMDDLNAGLTDGVFAKSSKNIYNKSKFTATEITYYVREYPQ